MAEEKNWYLWLDCDRSPYMNMSIDELLLQEADQTGVPVIRIYGWDRKSVSIGYVQSYEAAPYQEYTVVRRPTGGGIVYHDNDLTYTAVVPSTHEICKLNRMDSYHVFHRAVQQALADFGLTASLAPDESGPVDRATMQCFVTPTRYDVVAAGKKFAGAAQRRTRDGILHQGSIDLKASNGDRERLIEKLTAAFEKQFEIKFSEFKVSEKFLDKAKELAEQKYSKESWNKEKRYKD
jgi:lipoate-protein ligase A